MCGSFESTDRLLKVSPSAAKVRDAYGRTPLHHAAFNGIWSVFSRLLDAAPSVATVRDDLGRIPLHQAALSGSLDIVNRLLEFPGAAEARDRYENTPLHYAAFGRNLRIVRKLLEVNPRAVEIRNNNNGDTPLDIATGFVEIADVLKAVEAVVRGEEPDDWSLVPVPCPCPGLRKMLGSRSSEVVRRMTVPDRLALRSACVALHRFVPRDIVELVLFRM